MKINKENAIYSNFKQEIIKEIKEEKQYNGWSNYSTWGFKLWIDNDQNLYDSIYDHIKQNINKRFIISIAMEHLKEIAYEMTINQYNSNYEGSFKNDLLGHALNQINYNEISQVIIKDIEQELN